MRAEKTLNSPAGRSTYSCRADGGRGKPWQSLNHEHAMIPFESDNLKAYVLLLRIEVALRELLRLSLESEFGPQWRKRLPGELLKKIKESQTVENRPQFGYLRLGPLYYLSFGELLTLLQQKSGRPVAEKVGGDCVLKQLENIFVPRNAICHSRPVSSVGLKAIETLYAEMETALTADGLAQLVSKPDAGMAQDQAANGMITALKDTLGNLPNLPSSLPIPDIFQTATTQFWWGDDCLAGFNSSIVEAAFALIREYNSIPAGIGCAGVRQRFSEHSELEKHLLGAITELEKVGL